jgi:hypothetical protein
MNRVDLSSLGTLDSQASPAFGDSSALGSSLAAPDSAPEGRSSEFVAVDAGTEQYSGAKLLVVSYVFVWALLMAWIFLLWRKQQALGQRLDGLEAALDRAAAAKATPEPKARVKTESAPRANGSAEGAKGETTA